MELKGEHKGLTKGTPPATHRRTRVSDAQHQQDAGAIYGSTWLASCRGKHVFGFDV